MCDHCHPICKKCFEFKRIISCVRCGVSVCKDCINRFPSYFFEIAELLFFNRDNQANQENQENEPRRSEEVGGYFCESCYNYKRAQNMVRIMNGLTLFFLSKQK